MPRSASAPYATGLGPRRSRPVTPGVANGGQNARISGFLEGLSKMIRAPYESEQILQEDLAELVKLLSQSGNGRMVRGWRRELDPDGALEVDFPDFCNAARRFRWTGDAHLLFGRDNDFSSLTLKEVDPELGELFDDFRRWIADRFGSHSKLFKAFDSVGKGKVTREMFVDGCREYNFESSAGIVSTQDLNDLYDGCDFGEAGHVVLEDLIFLEIDPKVRIAEEFRARMNDMREWKEEIALDYVEKTRPTAHHSKHRFAPRPWQAVIFEQLPAVVNQRRRDRARDDYQRMREAWAVFRNHLREHYGSEVRAWRQHLDKEARFSVSQAVVRSYCSKTQVHIRVRDLWRAVDKDSDGMAAFHEICGRHALVLARFANWARTNFGSCVAVWDSPEAAASRRKKRAGESWSSQKKMLFGSLAEAVKSLKWPSANDPTTMSSLLSSLDYYASGIVTRDDFIWLDKWRTPEWLYAEADDEACEKLKSMLVRTFRHPLHAWRQILDRDGSNNLSWVEFKEACFRIGFEGNVAGAWCALDKKHAGTISMREFDQQSAELLESFKEWAEAAFGSVTRCFRALDLDGSGSITYPEMNRACNKLKWAGDVRLLFDCLDIDGRRQDAVTGKRAITLEELAFLDNWEPDPEKKDNMKRTSTLSERRLSTCIGTASRRPSIMTLAEITAMPEVPELPSKECEATTSSLVLPPTRKPPPVLDPLPQRRASTCPAVRPESMETDGHGGRLPTRNRSSRRQKRGPPTPQASACSDEAGGPLLDKQFLSRPVPVQPGSVPWLPPPSKDESVFVWVHEN